MVLAELMKRKRAQSDEALGEARGASRMHRLWTEWLSRKDAAEANGQPFDEPPPQQENGNGRGI